MDGGFILGVYLGVLGSVAIALIPNKRIDYKELVFGIRERIKVLFKKKEEDEL